MSRNPTPTDDTEESDNGKRVAIPYPEERKLWVRAGGRCAFCNKYLLEDEFFAYDLSTGEMAHIIGAKNSPKSPRGQHPQPEYERNVADNLILVCLEHHHIIDDAKTRDDFSVERLREVKKDHEDRIFHLTGLGKDRETAVIRVLGDVRGASTEVSREHARQAVFNTNGRYAKFPFSLDRQGIEVNLSSLPDPEHIDEAYWRAGKALIDRELAKVKEAVASGSVRHVSIFALTRIPLLIYLGYYLDDKIPTDFYQKQRGGNESWGWPDDESAIAFQYEEIRAGTDPAKVALILSISGSIPLDHLPAEIDAAFTVYKISPVGVIPNRDILRNRASLDAFARCYHDLLSLLEATHRLARTIHLFPAAPLTASIMCGRGIMRHVQPAIRVYDRISSDFAYALTVNEP